MCGAVPPLGGGLPAPAPVPGVGANTMPGAPDPATAIPAVPVAAALPGSLAGVLQNLVASLQAMVGVLGGGASMPPAGGLNSPQLQAQLAQGLAELQQMGAMPATPQFTSTVGRTANGSQVTVGKDLQGLLWIKPTGKPEQVTIVEGLNSATFHFDATGARVG